MRTGETGDRLRIRSGEELLVMAVLGTPRQRREVRCELDRRSNGARPSRRRPGDAEGDAGAASAA